MVRANNVIFLELDDGYNRNLHWHSNFDLLEHLYFSGKYTFNVEEQFLVSVETENGFKIGSNKVTDLGSLVTENDDEFLILVMTET